MLMTPKCQTCFGCICIFHFTFLEGDVTTERVKLSFDSSRATEYYIISLHSLNLTYPFLVEYKNVKIYRT